MELEEFKKFISQFGGLCWEEDCFLLYSLVKDLRLEADVIDIGSFKGRVSISLAQGIKDSGQRNKIYSLEANLFGTKDELLKNIECSGLKDLIVPIFLHSAKANRGWRFPLKLIWIDTDGNYFSGKCDFLLWEPYLVLGGIIALSCANSPNIKRIVKDCIIDSERFKGLTTFSSIVFAYKDKGHPNHPTWKTEYIRLLYIFYYIMKKINYNLSYKIFPQLIRYSTLKKLINKSFEIALKL